MENMRYLFFVLSAFCSLISYAQFDNKVSVNATANFNVALSGLGTDDAGIGANLQTSFFARNKLQLTTEAITELFFGNKALYQDPLTGKSAETRLHSFRIGPQFFFTKNIALSATYGPTWHKVREFNYALDYGYKVSLNSFPDLSRRMVVKASFVNVQTEVQQLRYLSFGLGYRF